MKQFYKKDRFIIGNRKDCDVYVKYAKPIYVYLNGIVNPSKQTITVNGKPFYSHVVIQKGDYIEYGSIAFRLLSSHIEMDGVFETKLIEKPRKKVNYNAFIPVYHDVVLEKRIFEIETFDVQLEKLNIGSTVITLITMLLLSVVMYFFLHQAIYLLVMLGMNMIVSIIQILLLIKKHRKHQKKFLQQKNTYTSYLKQQYEAIYLFFKGYDEFRKIFEEKNIFSRKKGHSCYLSVAIGEIPQDVLEIRYRFKNKWLPTEIDKQMQKLIKHYHSQKMLNLYHLNNKKTLLLNNTDLLDEIISSLIFYHSYFDLNIKYCGNFDFEGKHFCKITIEEVVEDDSLYLFDQFFPALTHKNITCIVLDTEIHMAYDEILEQKNDYVFFHKQKITVPFKKQFDLQYVLFLVSQYTVKDEVKQIASDQLLDVHQEVEWNQNHCSQNIIAYLSKNVKIDFHEKADGPHALVVGMTGSGKSELLQAIVVSLCIRYAPTQIQFVIIDYKGRSFASKIEQFPHVIGIMDNLNENLLRCIEVLKMEVFNRQIKFNQLQISHIDECSMPHLFIICDEFAELKKEQPAFIQELISISRIGRSLGIHLILATQKPSGIISEEILNNANLKIVMKLNDLSESNYLLKNGDALECRFAGDAIIASSMQYTKTRCMYVNGQHAIYNPHRIEVNQKIINDHQYFHYTQREYFIKKMHSNTKNIFELLPEYQSKSMFLIDEITQHTYQDFQIQNTVVYGDHHTGKTTTLINLIAQLENTVIYYIHDNEPLFYQKVVNISILDIEKITRLIYRLQNVHHETMAVVIDRFDYIMQYEHFEALEKVMKNSVKNNIYFIIACREELRFHLQMHFSLKIVLFYETTKRIEISGTRNLMNKNIFGRAWIKNKEVQLGMHLPVIDYAIDPKFQLEKPQHLILHQYAVGIHALRLDILTIKENVYVYAKKQQTIDHYLSKINHPRMIHCIVDEESILLEFNKKEHQIFLDEYSLTMFGDYTTTLNQNEALYIGIRERILLSY